jgi:hypothetical protein
MRFQRGRVAVQLVPVIVLAVAHRFAFPAQDGNLVKRNAELQKLQFAHFTEPTTNPRFCRSAVWMNKPAHETRRCIQEFGGRYDTKRAHESLLIPM